MSPSIFNGGTNIDLQKVLSPIHDHFAFDMSFEYDDTRSNVDEKVT